MSSGTFTLPGLSDDCANALLPLLQPSEMGLGYCFAPKTLEPVLTTTGSIQKPLEKWIIDVCPRDKCTQEDLDGGLTAIHEHCQTDMEEGNNAVVLINLALNNYTLGWRAMCAFEGRAPCASHVINTVQKQGHLELTNDYMEQLVSGRVEDMSPWISAYSSGKLCTSCGAAFFTNVRKIRPGILETYFGKSILNTCGQEFLTENVTVEDDPNAPSRTLTRPSASASANSGTTQIASGPLALAAAGVLAFSAYIL